MLCPLCGETHGKWLYVCSCGEVWESWIDIEEDTDGIAQDCTCGKSVIPGWIDCWLCS